MEGLEASHRDGKHGGDEHHSRAKALEEGPGTIFSPHLMKQNMEGTERVKGVSEPPPRFALKKLKIEKVR